MEPELTALADYYSDDESPFSKTAKTPEKQNTIDTSAGFQSFLLKEEILKAITDCGFEYPSEVQRSCIPQALLGTDILCQAKSGMGKTAVFVMSTLHTLNLDESTKGVQALIVCHTRELATQIDKEYKRFKKHIKPEVRTHTIVGGVPYKTIKKEALEANPHIVMGTPGTLVKIINDKVLDFSNLKIFVFDECDQIMESLELRKDAQAIFKMTPVNKQTMMFTATLSESTQGVCKKFLHNPHVILVNEGAKLTLDGLNQYFCTLQEGAKTRKLVNCLDDVQFNQCMIFVKSTKRAAALNTILNKEGFPSTVGFGKMPQQKREKTYAAFKEAKAPIMISTDLFARGIDFERVNFVVNYDMPINEDIYLHRVGRAGRFATKGLTVSFVASEKDREVLTKVREKFSVPLPEAPDHFAESLYR